MCSRHIVGQAMSSQANERTRHATVLCCMTQREKLARFSFSMTNLREKSLQRLSLLVFHHRLGVRFNVFTNGRLHVRYTNAKHEKPVTRGSLMKITRITHVSKFPFICNKHQTGWHV